MAEWIATGAIIVCLLLGVIAAIGMLIVRDDDEK